MRFLPGKMAEGRKLVDEMLATINQKDYGFFPPVRKYTPWIGGGNASARVKEKIIIVNGCYGKSHVNYTSF